MSSEPKSPFRQLYSYYRVYMKDSLLMLFFFAFQHMYVWFAPILMGLLVDLISEPDPVKQKNRFWLYSGILVAMLLWNLPASLLRTRYLSRLTRGISRDLRVDICRQLQQLSLLFHNRQSVGQLHSKAIRDIEVIEALPRQFIWLVFQASISIVVAVVTIYIRAPKALLFFLVLIPVCVSLQIFFRKRMKEYARRYRKKFEAMSSSMEDMMTMIGVTRAHGLEQHEMSRVSSRINDVFSTGRKFDILIEIYGASGWVSFTMIQVLVLLGTIYFCFQGALTVGDFVIFQAFFTSISFSLLGLVQTLPTVTQARDSMLSIGELLNAPDLEENKDKPTAEHVCGRFTLENVVYRYPSTEHHAINGISLEIPAGDSIAFVGPSGAGKSTMLALLLGFIRPDNGRILLDGQDMNKLDLRTYRNHIGVVTQDIVFFSGSILENVSYGMKDVTEEQVVNALEMANAREFIDQLPDGLHAKLGENGIKLSGGQHQRLAIARALIRDPRILILDEATSALDIEAEYLVQQALKRVMEGRTCFVVAHRLSTVRICNHVAILENGRVVMTGTHDELVRTDNFYSRAVKSSL